MEEGTFRELKPESLKIQAPTSLEENAKRSRGAASRIQRLQGPPFSWLSRGLRRKPPIARAGTSKPVQEKQLIPSSRNLRLKTPNSNSALACYAVTCVPAFLLNDIAAKARLPYPLRKRTDPHTSWES